MSLQHILLGLLLESPNSGYELNKKLEAVGQHIWLTEQSQIYRALYKMTSNGWVTYELITQDSTPNKKVYRVTPAGHREFESWTQSTLDTTPSPQSWMSQIFLNPQLSKSDMQQLIEERLTSVQKRLTWAENRHEQEIKQSVRKAFTLQYHINTLEAEIDWLQTSLAKLHETFPPE